MAGANGRQRVVGVEPAGDIHLGGKVLLPGDLKGDAQKARLIQVAAVRPPQVRWLLKAKGPHLAGVALEDALQAGVIRIEHTGFAQGEQPCLAFHIFLHVLVLHPADVVLRKVGEHPHCKGEAVDPQVLQPDGGGLHHTVFAPGVRHAAQVHLDVVAHGGGVVGLDQLLPHKHPYGADDPGLVAGGL